MKTSSQLISVLKLKSIFLFFSVFLFSCAQDESAVRAQVIPERVSAPETDSAQKKIKIALLLDTSNSMDGLIEQAKSQLWQLVNELSKAMCGGVKPTLQIALYEYGNSGLSSRDGYIRKVTALTDDLDQISADLFKLTTNGGDEYCGEVIKVALDELDWSRAGGDLQIIFIAGNEEFTQGNVDYKNACTNAMEKNIIVNTIYCGDFNEGIRTKWKHGADLTKGSYMSIEQNRKTVFIESPYDEKISALNVILNETYIGYGSKGKTKKEMQLQQDKNADSYGQANSVKRAVSKSSHFYSNKTWDLVDASEGDSEMVRTMESEALPEEMKTMSAEEKVKYIEEKKLIRVKTQAEIQRLNAKREIYVAENSKNNAEENMLDVAMISAIKAQAMQKAFTFN